MRGGAVGCALALALGFLCCLLFQSAGLAQSSLNSISFQGVLNGANGQPLPDGSYTLVFRFYDSPSTNQWRYATTNQSVAVAGGVASTAIAVDPSIFDGTTRYLGITVAGQNGGQELTLRVLVTAVPYALRAAQLAPGELEQRGLELRRYDDTPYIDFTGWPNPGRDFDFRISEQSPSDPRLVFRSAASDNVLVLGWGGRVGIGTPLPDVTLDVNGTTRIRVLQITGGSDLAEPFDVTAPPDDTPIVPGMVMVIDRERDGKLTPCARAYDTAVAGVLSGANGLQPGMVMQAEGQPHAAGEHPLAMTGRVWCLADAAHGPIQRGDRLTTSPTLGHAMKALDPARADGAVIGKAMSELESGTGPVLVLVNLQ